MNQRLKNWLETDIEPSYLVLSLDEEESQAIRLVRFPVNSHFDALYAHTLFNGQWAIDDDIAYVGMYSKTDSKIYDASRVLQPFFSESEKVSFVSLNALKEQCLLEVQIAAEEKIKNMVDNPQSQELVGNCQYDYEEIREAAILMILGLNDEYHKRSSEWINFWDDYKFNIFSRNDLFNYINRGMDFVEEQADWFIANYHELVLEEIAYRNLVKTEVNKIMENPDSPVFEHKNIIAAVKDSPSSMLSITIDRDGSQITFNTTKGTITSQCLQAIEEGCYEPAAVPGCDNNMVPTWFAPGEIVRITAGGTVLFDKES